MKVEKVCQCCQKQYSIRRDRADASKFCSKTCEVKSAQVIKVCRQCSGQFAVKASAAEKIHYCSPECRTLAGRVSLTCAHCGNGYIVKASHKDRSKFCSMSCKRANGSVDKTCECCGKSFTVPRRRNEEVRFCSIKCKTASGWKVVECEYCKKSFSCEAHVDAKFCSRACFHAAPKPSGEDHYKWVGDSYVTSNGYVSLSRSNLGGKLKLQHREVLLAALKADNPRHSFLQEVDGELCLHKDIEVHHIDHNRSNNELSNLLAVTKSAHVLIHMKNRKPDPWECWPSNPTRW